MSDYLSIYTGQQVDTAITFTLNLKDNIGEYITQKDVGSTVAELDTNTGYILNKHLPISTATTKGIVSIGTGLVVEDGVVSVDMGVYYNKTTVDQLLKNKADTASLNIPTKLSDMVNDIISVSYISDNNFRITVS